MNTTFISTLSSYQIATLLVSQINSITTLQLNIINTSQIIALTTYQINNLSLEEIGERFLTVYNNSWGGHHGFKKMKIGQVRSMMKAMKPN